MQILIALAVLCACAMLLASVLCGGFVNLIEACCIKVLAHIHNHRLHRSKIERRNAESRIRLIETSPEDAADVNVFRFREAK